MTTWPSSLPQYLDVRGASVGMPENRLRSDVDIGPAKLRPIVSLNVRPMSGTMRMNTRQWRRLSAFVRTTLQGGTLPFDFPDPLSPKPTSGARAMIKVRFADELPAARATSQGRWQVTLKLEVMP